MDDRGRDGPSDNLAPRRGPHGPSRYAALADIQLLDIIDIFKPIGIIIKLSALSMYHHPFPFILNKQIRLHGFGVGVKAYQWNILYMTDDCGESSRDLAGSPRDPHQTGKPISGGNPWHVWILQHRIAFHRITTRHNMASSTSPTHPDRYIRAHLFKSDTGTTTIVDVPTSQPVTSTPESKPLRRRFAPEYGVAADALTCIPLARDDGEAYAVHISDDGVHRAIKRKKVRNDFQMGTVTDASGVPTPSRQVVSRTQVRAARRSRTGASNQPRGVAGR